MTPSPAPALSAAAKPVSAVPVVRKRRAERPDPREVRGTCPRCGGEVVSTMDYDAKRKFELSFRCWEAMGAKPTCDFREVPK